MTVCGVWCSRLAGSLIGWLKINKVRIPFELDVLLWTRFAQCSKSLSTTTKIIITYPIVLLQISLVLRLAEVVMRLLCGMRTRPADDGMANRLL